MLGVRRSPHPVPQNAVAPAPPSVCTPRVHLGRRLRPWAAVCPTPCALCPADPNLGSTRKLSTSRSALTRPSSQLWWACSSCASALPAPCPPHSRPHSPARTARTPRGRPHRLAASPGPAALPALFALLACLRPSAARDGLQSAGQLRHVQRHGHDVDVSGARLPTPRAASVVVPSPLQAARTPRSAAASVPHRTVYALHLRPSAERDGLQPASQLRHDQRTDHVHDVRSALLPCLLACMNPEPAHCSPICSQPPPRLHCAHCMHTARSPAASRLPASTVYALLATSAGRDGLQSATDLRHDARHGVSADV